MTYPARHFPGTPLSVRIAVARAMRATGVSGEAWTVALEAIARYESNCEPCPEPRWCADCRGMMQQSVNQYAAARSRMFIGPVDYCKRVQGVKVAIRYIRSQLPGFGGYGGIDELLKRTDRGPGNVLRYWQAHPKATAEDMRSLYEGY